LPLENHGRDLEKIQPKDLYYRIQGVDRMNRIKNNNDAYSIVNRSKKGQGL